MTNRTSMVTVSDGDDCSEGYYNQIPPTGVTDTDTDASDHTETGTSMVLKRTFTLTCLSTDIISGVELHGIKLKNSDGGEDSSLFGFELSDGTTIYSPSPTSGQRGGWAETSVGTPSEILSTASTSYIERHFTYPGFSFFTGSTSWTIKIYIRRSNTTTSTATLEKGFSVRFNIHRRLTTLGSVVDA